MGFDRLIALFTNEIWNIYKVCIIVTAASVSKIYVKMSII